jgi:GNAT superfamily N-acetyltransferase
VTDAGADGPTDSGGDGDDTPEIRPYDPGREADRRGLWACKRGFETGLGEAGGTEKEAAYAGKLTDDYRAEWLDWVERCATDDPGCVVVAAGAEGIVGYAFLLPERLAFVWDAAVLNEIYVAEARRGTGLADRLFAAALDHARGQSLPLDRLVLDVDRENERARAFYERHGFTHWGEMVAREL